VRELVRGSLRFFGGVTLAALVLRLFFVLFLPQVSDDSRIYADLARNWLAHGIYGLSDSGRIIPTYIRLPGYPGFLAAVFAIFGINNFRAVMLIQVILDLGTCFMVADIARRMFSPRAAKTAFVLAAICPFLANYAGAVLTETLEIFFTALALDFAVTGFHQFDHRPFKLWIACGLSVGAAILLRPDGGLLWASMAAYLVAIAILYARRGQAWRNALWAAALVTVFCFLPLAPWTVRNLRTFHVFEPLTPRYANNPGDNVPTGFNHWVKTWMVDSVSVQEIYWQVPGGQIDAAKLPDRAFDSPEQRQRTMEIFDSYNQRGEIDRELDNQFEALARERIAESRFRYYVWVPLLRVADMWLRPRTELTDADPRWWEFNDDLHWSVMAVGFGILGVAYVALGFAGAVRGRGAALVGMLVLFVVLRSIFLGTLENPEARYTLECYPVLMVLAGAVLRKGNKRARYEKA
jgi:4-amino-4-deoxy-L-arabinose transferase-like glycosyltransferase